jgi:hypothetical protein
LANSPYQCGQFRDAITCTLDRLKVQYVISGFREGFRIGFHSDSVKLKSASSNCPSSAEHSGFIDDYLNTEIHAGRVFGPLKTVSKLAN